MSNQINEYVKIIGKYLCNNYNTFNSKADNICDTLFTLISERFPITYKINGTKVTGIKYQGFELVLYTTRPEYQIIWTTIDKQGEASDNFKVPFIKVFKKLKMNESQIEALLESIIFKYIA